MTALANTVLYSHNAFFGGIDTNIIEPYKIIKLTGFFDRFDRSYT